VVEKDGQVEGLGGLMQVEEKHEEQHLFEVDGKEVFSNRSKQAKPKTGASKPNPKQERRRIEKEEKGSECAGKHDGDRATSNAQ